MLVRHSIVSFQGPPTRFERSRDPLKSLRGDVTGGVAVGGAIEIDVGVGGESRLR